MDSSVSSLQECVKALDTSNETRHELEMEELKLIDISSLDGIGTSKNIGANKKGPAENPMYKCNYCPFTHFRPSCLAKHIKQTHGTMKCLTMTIESHKSMKEHIDGRRESNECDVCGKTKCLAIPLFAQGHVCLKCKKSKTEKELRDILAKKAIKYEIEIEIEEQLSTDNSISYDIGTSQNVSEQANINNATKNPIYKCIYCPNTYYNKTLSVQHIKKQHSIIKCPYCTFVTSTYISMKAHAWSHWKSNRCDVCGETEYLTICLFGHEFCFRCKKSTTEKELRKVFANDAESGTSSLNEIKHEPEIEEHAQASYTSDEIKHEIEEHKLIDNPNLYGIGTYKNGGVQASDTSNQIKQEIEIEIEEQLLIDNPSSYGTGISKNVSEQTNINGAAKKPIFRKNAFLAQHIKKQHSIIKCPYCTFVTSTYISMKAHVWSHWKSNKCDFCGKIEYLTISLFGHDNVCFQCKKSHTEKKLREIFPNKAVETCNTNDIKHEIEIRDTKCDVCGKTVCLTFSLFGYDRVCFHCKKSNTEKELGEILANKAVGKEPGTSNSNEIKHEMEIEEHVQASNTSNEIKHEIEIEEHKLMHNSISYDIGKSRNVDEPANTNGAADNLIYKCNYCPNTYFKKMFLVKHIKQMHSINKWSHWKSNKCDVCGETVCLTFSFFGYDKVCFHCKTNKTEKELGEILANKAIGKEPETSNLNEIKHEMEIEEFVQASNTSNEIKYEIEIEEHKLMDNSISSDIGKSRNVDEPANTAADNLIYKCNYCPNTYFKKMFLVKHIKQMHSINKWSHWKSNKCDVCGKIVCLTVSLFGYDKVCFHCKKSNTEKELREILANKAVGKEPETSNSTEIKHEIEIEEHVQTSDTSNEIKHETDFEEHKLIDNPSSYGIGTSKTIIERAKKNDEAKRLIYKCKYCPNTYCNKIFLVKHIKKMHSINKWAHWKGNKCDVCGKTVCLPISLFGYDKVCFHCKKSNTEKDLKEILANKAVGKEPETRNSNEIKHEMEIEERVQTSDTSNEIKHEIEEPKLIDNPSSYGIGTSKNIIERAKKNGGAKRLIYMCNYCPKTYTKKLLFDQHVNKAHSTMKCQYCTFATSSYPTMKTHVGSHWRSNSCDICGKTEYLTISLFGHEFCFRCQKNKTGEELRKILADKAVKKEAETSNSDESTPIVVSEECLKENATNDVQETGTWTTFNVTTGKFFCKFCPYESSTFYFLLRHQSKNHPNLIPKEYTPEYPDRPHKCTLCDFITFQFTDLSKHREKMHPKRKCTLCAFATCSAELFKSHMWEHENQEYCDICGQNEYLTFTFLSRQVCIQCKRQKTEAQLRAFLANLKPQKKVKFEQVLLTKDSNKNGGNDNKAISLTSIDLCDESSDFAPNTFTSATAASSSEVYLANEHFTNLPRSDSAHDILLLGDFIDGDIVQNQDKDPNFSSLEEIGFLTPDPPLLNTNSDNDNIIPDLTDSFNVK